MIGRQVLEGTNIVAERPPGRSRASGSPPKTTKTRWTISPGAGSHYIAVNNKVGPFANIDLRKALWAALDRDAMDKARGGELVTHRRHALHLSDDRRLRTGGRREGAEGRLQRTPRRRHGGRRKVHQARGLSERQIHRRRKPITGRRRERPPAEQDAEIVNQTLKNLGFNTKFTLVETSTMYAKYCGVPKEEIDVCPNVGWIADFADPQTVLNITFNGKTIEPTGNVNWGQTNDPKINAAMTAGETVVGTAGARHGLGEDRRRTRRTGRRGPVRLGQAGATSRATTCTASATIWNVGAWDYGFTSLK